MAELDQQMMMEHRMKKKTRKFYQKLFEASKTQKGTGDKNHHLLLFIRFFFFCLVRTLWCDILSMYIVKMSDIAGTLSYRLE